MSDLTPITREEVLLDGADLEPITRKEQFIKRIYDKTQEVPTPITREEWFLNKAGEGGSEVTVEQLNATENGTYSEPGKAYSPVIVEVPEPTLITKSITANGTYSASADNADGYSSVTVAVDGFKKKSIANTPTDIASFNDGTANPMPSLEIGIEPQQDLHGYDNPWAGGAGKNKLQTTAQSKTDEGITYTVNDDGTITVSGTATGYSSLAIGRARVSSSMGNITISGIASATNIIWAGCYVYDENNQLVVNITNGSTNPSITFDLSSYTNAYYLSVSVKRSDNVATSGAIKPQIEVGNVATSFAPYSNICPISGHTEANVTRCGVNLWDEEWESGGISNTDGQNVEVSGYFRAKNYIKVLPNTAYYIRKNSTDVLGLRFYDRNKSYVSSFPISINGTITIPNNVYYLRFVNTSGDIYNNDISINYPSTDTSYHAYNGLTLSIPFHDSSDNPVTVYGGTLNVTSGELRATHANIASYNGETINEPWISSMDIYSAGATPTTGAQVVYPLATPQTYQLTPTQVSTLLNQNNIFADCGQILQGEYFVTL